MDNKKPREELPEEPETKSEPRRENAITKLYDKLPFTFKQVDIFVKVLVVVLIAVVIYGVIKGNT